MQATRNDTYLSAFLSFVVLMLPCNGCPQIVSTNIENIDHEIVHDFDVPSVESIQQHENGSSERNQVSFLTLLTVVFL